MRRSRGSGWNRVVSSLVGGMGARHHIPAPFVAGYNSPLPAGVRALPEYPLEVYVYRTPNGLIGDFRSYLDGRDHSFDDHRPLPQADPRWEKIVNLRDPVTDQNLGGPTEFVGHASEGRQK